MQQDIAIVDGGLVSTVLAILAQCACTPAITGGRVSLEQLKLAWSGASQSIDRLSW